MPALHGLQRLRGVSGVGEGRADVHRHAPADRLCALAERGLPGDQIADRPRRAHDLIAEVGRAAVLGGPGRRTGKPLLVKELGEP